jgi:hypothetical protein
VARIGSNASSGKLGFAQMLRDVFVASINKGQFLVALIGFIVAIAFLKMPPADVSRVVFRIIDLVEGARLLGFAAAAVLGAGLVLACALATSGHCARAASYQSTEDGAAEADPGKQCEIERRIFMSYLIAALLAAAFLHLLFESIIAPSIRMKLRFELFSLRDDLRALKAESGSSLSDRQFECLQESLNALIAVLRRFDGATLMAVEQELRRNPLLRTQVEARARILDGCTSRRARAIRARSVQIATTALAVNSGGWFIYVLPVVLPIVGYSKVKGLIASSLALSENYLTRVPAHRPAIGA